MTLKSVIIALIAFMFYWLHPLAHAGKKKVQNNQSKKMSEKEVHDLVSSIKKDEEAFNSIGRRLFSTNNKQTSEIVTMNWDNSKSRYIVTKFLHTDNCYIGTSIRVIERESSKLVAQEEGPIDLRRTNPKILDDANQHYFLFDYKPGPDFRKLGDHQTKFPKNNWGWEINFDTDNVDFPNLYFESKKARKKAYKLIKSLTRKCQQLEKNITEKLEVVSNHDEDKNIEYMEGEKVLQNAVPAPDYSKIHGLKSVQRDQEKDNLEVALLTDGQKSLEARLKIMDLARGVGDTISFQHLITMADQAGRAFADKMIEKREQGVEVEIIIDALSAFMDPRDLQVRYNTYIMYNNLMASGIPVYGFKCSPNNYSLAKRLLAETKLAIIESFNKGEIVMDALDQRSHEKFTIVKYGQANDRKSYAIIGGRNVGNDYMGLNKEGYGYWRDQDSLVRNALLNDDMYAVFKGNIMTFRNNFKYPTYPEIFFETKDGKKNDLDDQDYDWDEDTPLGRLRLRELNEVLRQQRLAKSTEEYHTESLVGTTEENFIQIFPTPESVHRYVLMRTYLKLPPNKTDLLKITSPQEFEKKYLMTIEQRQKGTSTGRAPIENCFNPFHPVSEKPFYDQFKRDHSMVYDDSVPRDKEKRAAYKYSDKKLQESNHKIMLSMCHVLTNFMNEAIKDIDNPQRKIEALKILAERISSPSNISNKGTLHDISEIVSKAQKAFTPEEMEEILLNSVDEMAQSFARNKNYNQNKIVDKIAWAISKASKEYVLDKFSQNINQSNLEEIDKFYEIQKSYPDTSVSSIMARALIITLLQTIMAIDDPQNQKKYLIEMADEINIHGDIQDENKALLLGMGQVILSIINNINDNVDLNPDEFYSPIEKVLAKSHLLGDKKNKRLDRDKTLNKIISAISRVYEKSKHDEISLSLERTNLEEVDKLYRMVRAHKARIVHSVPKRRGEIHIEDAYVDMVNKAEDKIVISNSYFLPSPRLKRALQRAAIRGVDILVLTNSYETNDVAPVALLSRMMFKPLVDPTWFINKGKKIKIYEWMGKRKNDLEMTRGTNHAKFMIVDPDPIQRNDKQIYKSVAFIGSYNLDPRSRNINSEVGMVVQDRMDMMEQGKGLGQEMMKNLKGDLDYSVKIQYHQMVDWAKPVASFFKALKLYNNDYYKYFGQQKSLKDMMTNSVSSEFSEAFKDTL